MNVSDDVTKSMLDNVYGCLHSLNDRILRACIEVFQVAAIESVVSVIDISVSLIGNFNIITLDHMKTNSFMPQVDHFDFPDGRCVMVLPSGRYLNLGCTTGHPSLVLSVSRMWPETSSRL